MVWIERRNKGPAQQVGESVEAGIAALSAAAQGKGFASYPDTAWERDPVDILRGMENSAVFRQVRGEWGREFIRALAADENMSGMWIGGKDMPQETNRITHNLGLRHQWGLQVVNVNFDDHPNETTIHNHA